MQEVGEMCVDAFMVNNSNLITKLGNKAYGNDSVLSSAAFKRVVQMTLKDAYATFTKKGSDLEEIDSYLHGTLRIATNKELYFPRKKASNSPPQEPSSPPNEDSICADREVISRAYDTILKCINEQMQALHFNSHPSNYMVKLSIYKGFRSALEKYPEEMVQYLSNGGRIVGAMGVQSKIFQEFADHLEKAIPYVCHKGGIKINISSLLDDNLRIFDGQSSFTAEVNNKLEILNLTKEIYFGENGDKTYQPYYIGKLIDIKNLSTNESLMSNVFEYSCIKIIMRNVDVGTKVQISHLRIPPSYSNGSFKNISRLKKHLTERVRFSLRKSL